MEVRDCLHPRDATAVPHAPMLSRSLPSRADGGSALRADVRRRIRAIRLHAVEGGDALHHHPVKCPATGRSIAHPPPLASASQLAIVVVRSCHQNPPVVSPSSRVSWPKRPCGKCRGAKTLPPRPNGGKRLARIRSWVPDLWLAGGPTGISA